MVTNYVYSKFQDIVTNFRIYNIEQCNTRCLPNRDPVTNPSHSKIDCAFHQIALSTLDSCEFHNPKSIINVFIPLCDSCAKRGRTICSEFRNSCLINSLSCRHFEARLSADLFNLILCLNGACVEGHRGEMGISCEGVISCRAQVICV